MDKKIIKIIPKKRQLRERKSRKLYADEYALGDEEFETGRGFSVAEKLESPSFAQHGMVREMKGVDLNVSFFQQYGFNIPLLIKEKNGLGLQVPSSNFSVNDVRMCVGSRRVLDVMDVNSQKNLEMTMKEWQKYYEDPNKKKLLNVISLEFSHTKLENYVQSPAIVRQIDWVDVVWPRQLKEAQIDATNSLTHMMYPKVQKYCLMSVKNCYTDFHIDFNGTSVWYHILKGSKVFWLIPPTEKNLQLYEEWVLSGKQSALFFGDTVEKCARVYLTAGNTFFIPSGWIHAVYTPTDSLVFGGNFLHSFGIVKQLKIAQVEDQTKVPQKFRYPFFTEMLWYVLAKYVHTLLGHTHLEGIEDNTHKISEMEHIHLTHYELFGLKEIVLYLYDLPQNKKNVPDLIKDPVELIKDVRTLVERHCKDSPQKAITGRPILKEESNRYIRQYDYDNNQIRISTEEINDTFTFNPGIARDSLDGEMNANPPQQLINRTIVRGPYNKKTIQIVNDGESKAFVPIRRRRTRCKVCEACIRSDCGECSFCLDMVKFGGPGRAKQTCMMRQCLQPMLPITAQCSSCNLDGWRQQPLPTQGTKIQITNAGPSSLMECSVCYEIIHPDCVNTSKNIKGIINEDLPNSWECPTCCESGKNVAYRPRHFRARQKSSETSKGNFQNTNNNSNISPDKQSTSNCHDDVYSNESDNEKSNINRELNAVNIKREIKEDFDSTSKYNSNDGSTNLMTIQNFVKRRKSEDGHSLCSSVQDSTDVINEGKSENLNRKKSTLRTQLANKIMNSSNKSLKKAVYPVRPSNCAQNSSNYQSANSSNLVLEPSCLLPIFKYLNPETLVTCSLVCKAWLQASVNPVLWKRMNCTEHKLSASLLIAIVRRQPENLILDWTIIAKRQLYWIISRIPSMKGLSLAGVPIQSVFGLHTCLCPQLHTLDLSFVRGLNDHTIREILSPPKDSRPGTDSKSKLNHLKTLKLSGTDITDVSLRYITQGLPQLINLDLSSCQRVTDVGVCQIGTSANAIKNLFELDMSSCKLITEVSLEYLSKCESLTRLDLRFVPQVSTQAVIKFAAKSQNDLQVQDIKLVDKRNSAKNDLSRSLTKNYAKP